MSIEQNKLGLEVYKILAAKEYGYQLTIYDTTGEGTSTPLKAKWIYVKPTNFMIQLPDPEKIVRPEMYFWKTQGEYDEVVEQLITRLRRVANQFGIGLTVNDFSQDNTPKQFAKIIRRQNEEMELTEGFSGTSTRSFYQLPQSKMVINHSKKVNEEIRGSRSRNIKEIFIEVGGERFKFPNNNLQAAKAMAMHLNSNGKWNDKIVKFILNADSEIKSLKAMMVECLTNNNMILMSKAKEYALNIRSRLKRLQGSRGYVVVKDEILNDHRIPNISIDQRCQALDAFLGTNDAALYRCFVKYDIQYDIRHEMIYVDAIKANMGNIDARLARRAAKLIIKGNLKFISTFIADAINTSILDRISSYAYELSNSIENDLIAVILMDISAKGNSITQNESQFVLGVYKAYILNSKNIEQEPLSDFVQWINKD